MTRMLRAQPVSIRLGVAITLSCVLSACDPVVSRSIVVAPQPPMVADSARTDAFDVARRLALRFGMTEVSTDRVAVGSQRDECLALNTLRLCLSAAPAEARMQLVQLYSGRLRGPAKAFHDELVDSLRARFGAAEVKECKWRDGKGC